MGLEGWKDERRSLVGLAVQLCGSQVAFRGEARILKRLVVQWGPVEVERMLQGALALKWTSLKGLGSADGLGRRWALAKWTDSQKGAAKMPEGLKSIMRSMGG